ncbi:hypothetical protein EZH22_24140 [Xanthobacter dioxanivorans]|uniref:Uncharacterized protein n=1 Tax=Xanthobacter dioxanivorans TaxID=2528964 RepID=A0A974SMM4_9HYPH|nr:hypothetical protein [Xanthobacter dioxanivorans]QRG09923.1 hypothetical protein EZH22_24140 [Xanthobacter dioxanivorans]
MSAEPNDQKPSVPWHPEEMKATWDVRVGKSITIQASARWTPAGVVAAGIAASAVLLAISVLVRARRS